MRTALTILTDELRRLKAAGVQRIAVSEESLEGLRRAVSSVSGGSLLRDSSFAKPNLAAKPAGRGSPGPEAANELRNSRVETSSRNGTSQPAGALALPAPPVIELPKGDKATRWAALLDLVRKDSVCLGRVRPGKKVVLGVGNLDAKIMFVGEAPGAEEEVQGEPFVGPAGQLLNRMIAGMGVQRSDVYIGNIMNWRPELPVGPDGVQYGNRPPTPAELAYCLPYLRAQIEIVDPAILVALGATATQGLLGPGTFRALGEVRGQWREFAGRPLIVTYHPSYILRNPTNRSKRLIWEDFLKVMERAELPITDRQRNYFLEK